MPAHGLQRRTLRAATTLLALIAVAAVCATEPPSVAPGAPVPATAATPHPVPAPPVARSALPPDSAASPTADAERAPVELPSFQSGLWEFRRTIIRAGATKPQVSAVRKCGDPGADMRAKMDSLKKRGCQFAPLKRSTDRYTSSWNCQTPTGAMRFRDVLIVQGTNSYQDLSETHTAQHVTQQKIEARRLGECPGMGSGAPPAPTREPPARHP